MQGEFTQAKYGSRKKLVKLEYGDYILFYSPRTELYGGYPLQAFTAVGRIADKEPYQVEVRSDFHPWRRKVEFLDCHVAPIRPIIEDLGFIKDKTHWGPSFQQGLFNITEDDFECITTAMEANFEHDF